MLKIRFFRTGRKNQPFYRIVVTDSRNAPQGGKFIEKVGFFNPLTKEKGINEERVKYWLSVGAKMSDRIHNILVDAKVIEGPKVNVISKQLAKDQKESADQVISSNNDETSVKVGNSEEIEKSQEDIKNNSTIQEEDKKDLQNEAIKE